MDHKPPSPTTTTIPRLIIHGGSGNITRANLPYPEWLLYQSSLFTILRSTNALLSLPATTALDAAVHAVTLLEEDPLFNCGKGAVFTRAGRVELEASVMVSRGYRKRGVAVSMVRRVKSPIGLAKELLVRGNKEGGGGGQGHLHLSGEEVERLAEEWGRETCEESYFWTKKRWEEHRRGLEREKQGEKHTLLDTDTEATTTDTSLRPDGLPWPQGDPSWDGHSYLPQGTVGCVVLDRFGTLAVATSTGGLTNKLPGRIGDTPTIGAGFWAEEWDVPLPSPSTILSSSSWTLNTLLTWPLDTLLDLRSTILGDCLGPPYRRLPSSTSTTTTSSHNTKPRTTKRAVAMSGTGNGDSFLKLNAVRTVASVLRFSSPSSTPTLASAITWMTGPNGELQRSAGDRFEENGEGLGGIIGIEVVGGGDGEVAGSGKGKIAMDFNMGMFRAWVDDEGGERCMVFREEY